MALCRSRRNRLFPRHPQELHDKLSALRTSTSPFSVRVKDEAVTTWVRPKLVAEVRFTEWTSAGEMRHPVFLALRDDKAAGDVMRESEKRGRRR